MTAIPPAVPSPCVALCVLDAATGWCRGCGRTIDEIMAWGTASDIRKGEILDGYCRDLGRDPREVERSAGVEGDPAASGDALLDAGVTLLTVGTGGPDFDLGPLREWLAWRDDLSR